MTRASFAVFNQVVGGLRAPRPVYAYPAPVVIEQPVPVHRRVVVAVTPPPPVPSYSNVVHHPHGRYELRGDGVYTALSVGVDPERRRGATGASPSAAVLSRAAASQTTAR